MRFKLTAAATADNKQLVVPASVLRRAGFKAGDRLEFKVSGPVITITPAQSKASPTASPNAKKAARTTIK